MLHWEAVVDEEGYVNETLCRRVRPESVADEHASDKLAAPTCARCLRAVARRRP